MADYINVKSGNWEIQRGRNIDISDDKWVRFKYIEDGNVIEKSLPNCEPIYYKFDGNDIIEMSTSEKSDVDADIQYKAERQPKEPMTLMSEIFNAFTGDDLNRIINCIDKKGSFKIALEGYNYILARQIMEGAKAEGLINQIDYNLIDNILPKQD